MFRSHIVIMVALLVVSFGIGPAAADEPAKRWPGQKPQVSSGAREYKPGNRKQIEEKLQKRLAWLRSEEAKRKKFFQEVTRKTLKTLFRVKNQALQGDPWAGISYSVVAGQFLIQKEIFRAASSFSLRIGRVEKALGKIREGKKFSKKKVVYKVAMNNKEKRR